MKILGTPLAATLSAVLIGCASAATHTASTTKTAAATESSTTTALSNATIVQRCLPQLTRKVSTGMDSEDSLALSSSSVQVAKPLVPHKVGDLVAFVAKGHYSTAAKPDWVRLDSLCRVPETATGAAPGSSPLSASATVPGPGVPARNAQLCNEAFDQTSADTTGFPSSQHQVVAPDTRRYTLTASAWQGHSAVLTKIAADTQQVVTCGLRVGGPLNSFQSVVAARLGVTKIAYLNGSTAQGTPDTYWGAGAIPSVGAAAVVKARSIVIKPPNRTAIKVPVTIVNVGGGTYGVYAFAAEFTPVTASLGTSTTKVQVLDGAGAVLWSGTWDVGIEGH